MKLSRRSRDAIRLFADRALKRTAKFMESLRDKDKLKFELLTQ